MRTLEQIMDSLEQSIYLRARERRSNQIRDELLEQQHFLRQEMLERAFKELDQIDQFYLERQRAPQ